MLRPKLLTLFAVVFLALPVGARAAELVTFKTLSPALALELAQKTLEACREEGYQVAVSVVDRSGILQVTLRDRLAGPHTPEVARRKAWTALTFRTDTVAMAENTREGQEQWGVRFVADALMVGGGVPVEAGGAIVGAVGVSGAPGGALDDTCARVGIEAIVEKLEF